MNGLINWIKKRNTYIYFWIQKNNFTRVSLKHLSFICKTQLIKLGILPKKLFLITKTQKMKTLMKVKIVNWNKKLICLRIYWNPFQSKYNLNSIKYLIIMIKNILIKLLKTFHLNQQLNIYKMEKWIKYKIKVK